jgi:peptidase inhibitor family I36
MSVRISRPRFTATLIYTSVIVVGIFAGVLLARPSIAFAAGKADCPTSTFCLWQDINFSGTRWDFSLANYQSDTWYELPSASKDQASSLYNNRAHVVYYNDDLESDIDHDCSNPGGYRGDLRNYTFIDTVNENDHIARFNLRYSELGCG